MFLQTSNDNGSEMMEDHISGSKGAIEIDLERGLQGMVDKRTIRQSYRDWEFKRSVSEQGIAARYGGKLGGDWWPVEVVEVDIKRPHWLTPFNLPIIIKCVVDIMHELFTDCLWMHNLETFYNTSLDKRLAINV
ncbi:hypothetical protein BBBOND_0305390 [Babesia bigemina]|uniref:Uncharacterized protein n=1 Tax=Babesia bigemina TaxID=5866 RepID=A0A061D7E8_BABBI|nr:hypothetical protein BBBOND_0305390 [Babesia bigemina]CDR96636.1 hypothetical protein BBBOND_0305390 [Babesia bigemina]|eukprot:XP_012768822.1 hypothetical protein BBBOND_0305390 [Babesia bigemina]